MAFDEQLAERVRKNIGKQKGLVEKKMFGGLAFLLNGNMSVGIHKTELIVRLDPDETDAALAKPHTRIFDITGKPMKGWILVKPAGLKDNAALGKWVKVGINYAAQLEKKK